ncbi:MAG: hypothetical protein AABY22_21340 [Nanoarchaeota archaeon]
MGLKVKEYSIIRLTIKDMEKETSTSIKLNDLTAKNIVFNAGEPMQEIIKLTPEYFYYKGKKVRDINKIYQRFSEWMNLAEKTKLK